ncbi:MAG: hypothetical protein CMJ58_25760 [Planctomycetaceae bacterium]|nr:hypothetical protein [Planctomycetaceae bacterium]
MESRSTRGTTGTARGATLVELLIVIAILSLLLQLALPAVENAREAARRTACQNNLRQIGLAALGHEAAQETLPAAGWGWGWMGDPDRGVGKNQPGSWCYQLLPYLEGQPLHDLGRGLPPRDKAKALALLAATPQEMFYCPSRRLARPLPNVKGGVSGTQGSESFWYNANRSDKLAKSDYVGNIGDRWVYWGIGPTPAEAAMGQNFLRLHDVGGTPVDAGDVSGVLIQRRPLKLRQIEDGLSRTYFVGEKPIFKPDYKTGVPMNDDQSVWQGDDMDLMASTQFPPRCDPPEFSWNMGMPFGSAHPDGFNMAFCDGSVQFVSYEIAPATHNESGNRFDGIR